VEAKHKQETQKRKKEKVIKIHSFDRADQTTERGISEVRVAIQKGAAENVKTSICQHASCTNTNE